ncbi:MAG: hypothetical protein A4E73_00918 [Syntrophaceae bacterium PtaU1.Bin231]|nr:MAG: hypothetical protein A4E73_00918 [Syntrophaceae bacterium PtaU1.Bin231]
MSKVAAVAHGADPVLRFARKHRPDVDAFDAGAVDALRQRFIDQRIRLDQDFARVRVIDVFQDDPAENAFSGRLDDLAAFHQGGDVDSINRTAVLFRDDAVLRDIDEPAGQISRIGRLERRIGEALPGAVRRDEILQDRKPLAEVGRDRGLDDFPRRFRHEASHPCELADLHGAAPGTGVRHHVDGVEALGLRLVPFGKGRRIAADADHHFGGDLFRRLGPDIDDLVVALAVGDQTVHVLLLDPQDVLVGLADDILLVGRNHQIVQGKGNAGDRRVPEAQILEAVGQQDRRLLAAGPVAVVDEARHFLLVHQFVDGIEANFPGHDFIQHDAPDCGLLPLAVDADLDPRVQVDDAGVQGSPHFFDAREDHPLALDAAPSPRQVVNPQDDVLAGNDDRFAVRGGQDVVGGHHQHAGFRLCFDRKRHVDGHLVAVEVRIESGADERMQLDGLPFDQQRFERLHAEPVQGGRPVQHDRVLAHDFVQGVPNLRGLPFDHLLGALDGRHISLFVQPVVDERFEQLQRHFFRKAALVQPQIRPDHDDGPAGVIDALSQQVLTETALLPLEHVRQGAQRPLVRSRDGPAPPTVVEQDVDGFLQHALLVPDDDLGCVQFLEPLQAIVPVDHPAVQVVQVGGREAAAVQGHQRPEVRRNDGKDRQDHPFRPVSRLSQRLDDLQSLDEPLALRVGRGGLEIVTDLLVHLLEIDLLEDGPDGFGADSRYEGLFTVLFLQFRIFLIRQKLLLLQRRLFRIEHDPGLEIQDTFQFLQGQIQDVADAAGKALEEPDMRDRRGQHNVAHPLAANLGLDHFHTAFFAHHAPVLHALVASAQTLVVFDRSENLGAEQSVALGLEGPVIDRLRFLDFAVRPGKNLLRRGDRHPDRIETDRILRLLEIAENVFHRFPL